MPRRQLITQEELEEEKIKAAMLRVADLKAQLKAAENVVLNLKSLKLRMLPRFALKNAPKGMPNDAYNAMESVFDTALDEAEEVVAMIRPSLDVVHETADRAVIHRENQRRQRTSGKG